MKKRFSKKAFTMVELMICLICLGFLTIGIGAFATAMKTNAQYISDREGIMLHEYQDVLYLRANGTSNVSLLNNSEYLIKADAVIVGSSFNINSYFTVSENQKAEYIVEDVNVVTVNSDGECSAISEGVTYVKVDILTMGSDGTYHHDKNVKYIPIVVYNNSNYNALQDLEYYFYGGKYYACWIYGQ